MSGLDIVSRRLLNQRIAGSALGTPRETVAWMGALQAQDYRGVKWAIGLRSVGVTDAQVEEALAEGSILRTWLLRGTLHVVAAADVRWMLSVVAPRLIANSAGRYRQLDLEDRDFRQSYAVLERVLQDGQRLTRAEVLAALQRDGISTDGQRGYHILRRAGLERLICFGPMAGKEQTFVLLEDPAGSGTWAGDEALGELARRYFAGHGPATLADFVWWSGLTMGEARTAIAVAGLAQADVDGETYWYAEEGEVVKETSPAVHLLPAYDEYFLGYAGRELVLDPQYDKQAVSSNGVFRPVIVVDGQVVGIWKQTVRKNKVLIAPTLFRTLSDAEGGALRAAVERYGAFLGLTATPA